MELPYTQLPDPPSVLTAGTLLARVIDGLAFRFRWATEGLTPEQGDFHAGEGVSSIRETMGHILFLAERVNRSLGGAMPKDTAPTVKVDGSTESGPPSPDLAELRRQFLGHLESARACATRMTAEQITACELEILPGMKLPIWHLFNGPLADALTHVGQINTWRRMAGNPPPKANVLLGRPPKPH